VYPLGRVIYGAVGAGWYNTTFDFRSEAIENRTHQKVGWHFGGGLELPLARSISLTGDVRYVFLDYDFETIPGSGDTDADFYLITVGLLLGI
jgi:opacity protein-like surface antigen